MMFGEMSPGGVGVGLMGMLSLALLAVFIAGLMVGRTPEYLGKKIQAPEMKLVTLYILAMPFALLPFAAASVLLRSAATYQAGAHGLSEVLYNFASSANNNGSAFAYQGTGTQWYTTTQGISMLIGRFFTDHPGTWRSAARWRPSRRCPRPRGTMPTNNSLFGFLIVGVIVDRRRPDVLPGAGAGPRYSNIFHCEDRVTATMHPRTGQPGSRRPRPPKVRRKESASKSIFDRAIVGSRRGRCVQEAEPADHDSATR